MTPTQQSALAALAGRALTEAEVAQIDAHMTPLGRDDAAIAAVLSVGRKRVVSGQTITTRGAAARFPVVAGLLGPLAFEAAMLALETFASANADAGDLATKLMARAVRRQLQGFQDLGLDFGEPALRSMLDSFVPAILSPDQAAGFKALAEAPDPVPVQAVVAALNEVGA